MDNSPLNIKKINSIVKLQKRSSILKRGILQKILFPCQKRIDSIHDWLKIQNMIKECYSNFKDGKDIVIKYGTLSIINKEYMIYQTLNKYNVPNIIKYYCSFTYLDKRGIDTLTEQCNLKLLNENWWFEPIKDKDGKNIGIVIRTVKEQKELDKLNKNE